MKKFELISKQEEKDHASKLEMYNVRKSWLHNENKIKELKLKNIDEEKKKLQGEIDKLTKSDDSPNINIFTEGYHAVQLKLIQPKLESLIEQENNL